MKPYYDDGTCVIYHADCREVEEWQSAELLVTDPPYGIGWTGLRKGWTNARGGGGHKSRGMAREIVNDADTTVRDGALALWGDKPGAVFGDLLAPHPRGACHVLVYAKPQDAGILGAKAGRRRDIEAIFLIGSWPVGIGGASSVLTTGARVAGPRGLAVRYQHPHAKPLDVLCQLVALADGVVADPFMGSGSTLVAAKSMNRRAIGIEIDERYCEIAAKRLAQEVLNFGGAA